MLTCLNLSRSAETDLEIFKCISYPWLMSLALADNVSAVIYVIQMQEEVVGRFS